MAARNTGIQDKVSCRDSLYQPQEAEGMLPLPRDGAGQGPELQTRNQGKKIPGLVKSQAKPSPMIKLQVRCY